MRSGLTNTAACKILGVSRRLGSRIRQRSHYQTVSQTPAKRWSGRYLSLPERLRIADLLGFGWSLRKIAVELGRSPSTIKRELDRHRDNQGRYLPAPLTMPPGSSGAGRASASSSRIRGRAGWCSES